MTKKYMIGDKKCFGIEYAFNDYKHETEFALFVKGVNILEFEKNGSYFTTCWNLDELVFWLRDFLDNIDNDDPYPIDCCGKYAAIKDIVARNFETENEEAFDAYYDKLDSWNLSHRWHTASSGAILADVYFQQIGNNVEISWNNEDLDEEASFQNLQGGCSIDKKIFVSVMSEFLKKYANHWFNENYDKEL